MSNQVGSEPKAQGNRSWVLFAIVAVFALGAMLFALSGAGTLGALLLSGVGGTKAEVGKPAPAFKVTTTLGMEIDSLKLHGSVIVVNFFASWCKPCQAEAHDMEEIWKEYQNDGVIFVGIAYEDTDVKIAQFVSKYGITFPVATSARDVGRDFGVTGVPETYVIDREGIVRYKQLGAIDPAELTGMIEYALQ